MREGAGMAGFAAAARQPCCEGRRPGGYDSGFVMSVRLVLRLGFALGTVAPTAQAAETVYLVGTASSRDCVPQFATIQAAIDAASGNARGHHHHPHPGQ
jgi:hypothetical protein